MGHLLILCFGYAVWSLLTIDYVVFDPGFVIGFNLGWAGLSSFVRRSDVDATVDMCD